MIFPPLLRDSSGNIIPQIWDGANWQPYKGQVEGLEALTLLIEGLSQTDYATDAKLEAVRSLVEAISQKDFATETTLVKVLNKLSADPATATQQETLANALNAISNAVAAKATEQTLEQIKTALTDGTQQVQLTGKKETLRWITANQAATIEAGGSETITIEAAPGTIAEVHGIVFRAFAPVGATIGAHVGEISVGMLGNGLYGRAPFNTTLSYQYGYWYTSGVTGHPSDVTANVLMSMTGALLFSDAIPLLVKYTNNTDTAQTQERVIRMLVLERGVV